MPAERSRHNAPRAVDRCEPSASPDRGSGESYFGRRRSRDGRRRWGSSSHDDPLAGLINLFDVWMVFSIALLIALIGYLRQPGGPLADEASRQSTDLAATQLESVRAKTLPLERFRESRDALSGEGERLGTAYRLKSGEVVYVPENAPPTR